VDTAALGCAEHSGSRGQKMGKSFSNEKHTWLVLAAGAVVRSGAVASKSDGLHWDHPRCWPKNDYAADTYFPLFPCGACIAAVGQTAASVRKPFAEDDNGGETPRTACGRIRLRCRWLERSIECGRIKIKIVDNNTKTCPSSILSPNV